jgi:signal transduction histidine kinase
MSSDEGIRMIVANNGIGIDSKYLPEIFKPYKRFARVGEGKGLGLYMVFV